MSAVFPSCSDSLGCLQCAWGLKAGCGWIKDTGPVSEWLVRSGVGAPLLEHFCSSGNHMSSVMSDAGNMEGDQTEDKYCHKMQIFEWSRA